MNERGIRKFPFFVFLFLKERRGGRVRVMIQNMGEAFMGTDKSPPVSLPE